MPVQAVAKDIFLDDSGQWVVSADVRDVAIVNGVSTETVTTIVATVPNDDEFKALTAPQKKARLVAALKAERDRTNVVVAKPAWSGTVML